ncbi:LLM class F420-dependent oxidoreductase [Nocardia tengchongensis]|uniref:LLM class F420-dependent oxidoreductase n=1 Tax=Nocardia tengchongensis TaxID=2055889 RepID=UPI003674D74B
MKYAIIAPAAAGTSADPAWISGFAKHVEACGFESLVAIEHAVVMSQYSSVYPYASSGKMELPDDCDIPDPLELLAFLAGQTTTLGLATGVLVLPNHHPVVLAKRLATLDRLSNGRLRVGIGMGWMKEEIEACGAPFEARGRRADEQLEVLAKLWAETGETGVDHKGEFFSFQSAMCYPKPVRAGGVPIHVGGHTKAAARRAGRYGAGLQPLGATGDQLAALVALMHEEATRADRDPAELELSLGHMVARIDLDRAGRLAEQGADRLLLAPTPTADLDQAMDELSACAQRLGLS